MLLVRDWMAREVVTVETRTTAAEALALCRKHGIRHLPVLEGGRLIGVISDRDLRSATPALGDPSRAEVLERIRVGDEMLRDVVTARPEDPVEDAAAAMYEGNIGCLPVVDGDDLVGIVTSSNLMRALAQLVGVHEPGSRLEVALPDRPGSLAEIAGITRDAGVNIVSVLVTLGPHGTGQRVAVLRLATIDTRKIVADLGEAGYPVLWPPKTHPGEGRA
ncbi:MAG: CBS and ACT domain-containing protein, partial [Actinomycetota bacterium]|nr:CBS and ACT domain-containing protein [Actinomycetota bacterium]